MKFRTLSEEVLYSDDPIPNMKGKDLETLVSMAKSTARQRIRLCTHADQDSLLQEMLIVHGKSAYVRPHKHIDKDELIHVCKGQADLIFFDEAGAIIRTIHLGEMSGEDSFCSRVPVGLYHMLIIRSDVFVFYERTTGPFNRDNMMFAPWAAEDGSPEALDFVTKVDSQMNRESHS